MPKAKFPIIVTLPPHGDDATKSIQLKHERNTINQVIPGNDLDDGPCAWFDWFNDQLQLIVTQAGTDEPAVLVKFRPDGTIKETIVR